MHIARVDRPSSSSKSKAMYVVVKWRTSMKPSCSAGQSDERNTLYKYEIKGEMIEQYRPRENSHEY